MSGHVAQEAGKKIHFYFANQLGPGNCLVFEVKQMGPLETKPNRSVQQLVSSYIRVSVLNMGFNFLL